MLGRGPGRWDTGDALRIQLLLGAAFIALFGSLFDARGFRSVGGGLEIAMACDLRIAARDGGKIGLPEVNLGVLPGTGGTQRLARILGKSKSIEVMATGELFTFDQAKDMGLVNQVFAKESFWDDVMTYAKQFVPPGKAARAVGGIKRAVCSGLEVPFARI